MKFIDQEINQTVCKVICVVRLPYINGLDASEQELARQKCDYYDEYNRKTKGELVITARRLVFLDKHHLHHTIDLEKIQGFYVETTGIIGAYLRVDYESPNGIAVARYYGSLAQAEFLMSRIKVAMHSNGSIRTYERSSVASSSSKSLEVPLYSRPRVEAMKGRFDLFCICGLCCLWMGVGVIVISFVNGVWRGYWAIWPGYEILSMFLSIGYIAFTVGLTLWWALSKGKKPVQ